MARFLCATILFFVAFSVLAINAENEKTSLQQELGNDEPAQDEEFLYNRLTEELQDGKSFILCFQNLMHKNLVAFYISLRIIHFSEPLSI